MLFPFLLAAALPADYAGAAACRECHSAEYQSQSGSAHAAALARSKPPQPGAWAFGAGRQAITFVDRFDAEHYLELGLTWYKGLDAFALTPGHRDSKGVPYRIFDPAAAILRCFACHTTGPLSLAPGEAIAPYELGVRCEACHGPAAAHARDPARNRMSDPRRLSASDLNQMCGACHRMPAAAGDATDLRNPWNARHQPLLLAASRCFRESQGRLSCVTCHSPHAPLETKLAAYDKFCRNCHVAPTHTQPLAGRPCASCHMPSAKPSSNLAFANHRIAIFSTSDPMTPIAAHPRH